MTLTSLTHGPVCKHTARNQVDERKEGKRCCVVAGEENMKKGEERFTSFSLGGGYKRIQPLHVVGEWFQFTWWISTYVTCTCGG